jgi:hypothetical protein
VQFVCEFFALLFGEHKFVANDSVALNTDVNDIHLSSLRASAKQSRFLVLSAGLLRRGACHRAGHFGPDPLAPRNDE